MRLHPLFQQLFNVRVIFLQRTYYLDLICRILKCGQQSCSVAMCSIFTSFNQEVAYFNPWDIIISSHFEYRRFIAGPTLNFFKKKKLIFFWKLSLNVVEILCNQSRVQTTNYNPLIVVFLQQKFFSFFLQPNAIFQLQLIIWLTCVEPAMNLRQSHFDTPIYSCNQVVDKIECFCLEKVEKNEQKHASIYIYTFLRSHTPKIHTEMMHCRLNGMIVESNGTLFMTPSIRNAVEICPRLGPTILIKGYKLN